MAPHQLIYLFARGCFEPRLHLFTHHWGCHRHERVCATARVRLHVQWMLQQAHLVAMCQCHWPLCSPSGWYTRSASSDSCSIRGPSRLTDAQTHKRCATQTRARGQISSEAESEEAWKWIPPLRRSFTYFNRTRVLLAVERDYSRGRFLWLRLKDPWHFLFRFCSLFYFPLVTKRFSNRSLITITDLVTQLNF